MAKSIFQISPVDAEIERQNAQIADSDMTAPALDPIGALPPLPELPRSARSSTRSPGRVAPPTDAMMRLFVDASVRHQVPLNIVMALAEQESSYNPMAVGTQTQWGRAKGLMQYLDSTAAGMGINPFDPAQAIDAAAKQLRQRLDRGYSMRDAVMEHHAGPDRKLWGPVTRRYGVEVLDRASRLKGELAPKYGNWYSAGAAPDNRPAPTLSRADIARVTGADARPAPVPSLAETIDNPNSAKSIFARYESEKQRRPGERGLKPASPDSWMDLGGKLVERAGPLFKQAAGGLAQALVESAAMPPPNAPLTSYEYDQMQRDIDEGLAVARERKLIPGQKLYEAATADLAENNYDFGGSDLKKYATMIAESMIQMAPALTATMATRNPYLLGGLNAMQVGGAQYGESRDQGRARDEALRDAVFMGAAEAIGEQIPVGILMKPGGRFLGRTLKAAGAESAQEVVTQVLQTGYDMGVLHPDMTWAEARQQVIDAAIVGAGMGAGMSVATAPFNRGEAKPVPGENMAVAMPRPSSPPDPVPTMEQAPGSKEAPAAPMGEQAPPVGAETPSAPAQPPPPIAAAPPVAPAEAPAGPLSRAMASAPMAPPTVDVPMPVAADLPAQPVTLVTPAGEFPVQFVGETPDAVWVKTESGEELQIPRTEIDSGSVQIVAPATLEQNSMVAAPANAPSPVKEDLTGEARRDPDVGQQVEPVAPDAQKPEIIKAPEATPGKATLERVDPETGEIVPAAPKTVTAAPAASPKAAKPAAAPSSSDVAAMDEPALRARLKYLHEQARTNAGWTKPLLAERKKVEAAIDRMTGLRPDAIVEEAAAPPQDVAIAQVSATPEVIPTPDEPAPQPAIVEEAAAQAAMSPLNDRPEPTEAQKQAGNYAKGHVLLGGIDISIENPAGTQRDPKWKPLQHAYGYVKRSEGADGDHVDVFLGPKADDVVRPVYVVDQVNKDGSFDEHKVMVGFESMEDARVGYLANYEDGWTGLGAITEMPFDQFKAWVRDPAQTAKPMGKITRPAAAEAAPPVVAAQKPTEPAVPRGQPVPQRPTDKTNPNPYVRKGERVRFAEQVEYLGGDPADVYVVQQAGKKEAWFVNEKTGGRSSLANYQMAGALRRGVMQPVVEVTPAPSSEANAPQKDAEPKSEAGSATLDPFARNKLITADKVEAARARLREKMGRLNSGIDPEIMVDGMTIAAAYIEAGVRKFADYAKAMRADFGERITPYLLSFWEGARHYPGLDTAGMTSPEASRAEHTALLAEGLPAEEASALGTEVARPKPKAKKATSTPVESRTLRDDWGVEHIDGYAPIDGGQNIETDEGLKGGLKDAFLQDGLSYLRGVASLLRPLGFAPHVDGKGKEENPVRKSAGGAAGSGDITLVMRHPERGANIYVTIGATAMRGAVPSTKSGVSIMYRVSRKDGDKYATSGVNRWTPVDLSALDLADTIAWEVGRGTPELARDHVAEPEPVVQSPDRGRLSPDEGGRGAAQSGPASVYPSDLGTGQPANVGEPEDAGADGEVRLRPAGTDVASAGRAAEGGVSDNGRARGSGARGTDAGTGTVDPGRQRPARNPSGRAAKSQGSVAPAEQRDVSDLDLFAAADSRAATASPSPARSGPGNFLIANPLEIVGGGPVARFDRNRKAIETYSAIRDDGRTATAEEQRILAGYTGWGSFGQELFQGTWDRPMPKEAWQERDRWLRDQLGKDEWESAQRSITNAHYTDPPTVMAMWAMMQRMGFDGGRVLEPSMGIGNFFGMMPAAIAARSQLAGIELDSLTGGMAQMLYPDANVRVMPYQASKTPDGLYDLVIGNWPFENTVIADRRYDRLSPYLHDYFFLKALDQVRPGGIVMGITSSGTMDKKATGIRRELAKKAELVAAFRLPSGAFAEYAGTKVVTDIIILKKRAEPISLADREGWIDSTPYQTPNGEVSINEYYQAHPDHVIGTIDFGHGTTRGQPGMIVHRPDDMQAQLQRIVEAVPIDAYQRDNRTAHISFVANHTADREGALTRTDAGLFVVRGEHMAPAQQVVPYAVKDAAKTAQRVDQLERLIDMRRAYGALIEAERTSDATSERKTLKARYDDFVKAHGPVNDSFGLAYLKRIDDPFHASLAALEIDGKPAAILSRSTTRPAPNIENPTIADAFVLERNAAVSPSIDAVARRARVTVDQAKAELLKSGAVFELPNGDVQPADIYLSGNVREKLRQAKAAVDEGMAQLARNVEALKAVVPPDVPYFKIETQLGATWISPNVYAEFVGHMLGLPDGKGVEVRYNGGRWSVRIDDKLKSRTEASTGFGTGEYSFQRLVNAAFGNQSVTIRRRDSEGKQYVDNAATEEVNGKITEMRTKFGEWLWSDPERRVAVEAEYNEVRNAFATPRFDGSFLKFEGMALSLGNGPFDLRQHQADAIWRALVSRRSLNAHEVGTGKTFTMGGIAVESRRYGIARKPLILAHNANSKSVATEIQMMYPAAKILYIDNLTPDTIDVKMRQIANDDWDAVVVPHSLIDRFAFREETLMEMAREEIAALEEEAYLAAADDGADIKDEMWDDPEELKKLRSPTAKELVKMRQRIIETIRKQSHRSSREGAIPFEELGVDMLMVDEAHEFKKPPISTRMKMKGLNTQTSDRSIALSFLTRYVRANNAGGNVHLFTGTPVTNTLTEVFHMMRYIMQDEMQAAGVDQWDGWFGSFAREVMDVEQNAAAEYEAVTRLAGFINVPELRRMIGQYMDVVFADDMPEMQPRRTKSGKTMADELNEAERAELLNGRTEGAKDRPYKRVINVTSDLTPKQKVIFEQLRGYARAWRAMSGKERRDAMASGAPESPIITEGLATKASFDVRLMLGEQLAGMEGKVADDPGSKASNVVDNVKRIYDWHPMTTQVIFAEQGFSNRVTRSLGRNDDGKKQTRSVPAFSTVRDIVERLVQAGIPREQIAVVDGSTSKENREKIAQAMNAAKIRVVIGSTGTLGVGVNMQRNLRAMHHMDAPWMPGDLEQRNGRGQRQRNQWNTVEEYRYLTDRLDGRRWQVLAIKQRFITAFLKADDNARVIEGEAAADEQSDILQSFAEAAGDPRILIREKLRKQLDGAQRRERLHGQGVANAIRQARWLETSVKELADEVAAVEERGTLDKVSALIDANAGKGFAVTINGKTFDKRRDADDAVLAWAAKNMRLGDEPRAVGAFGGHELLLGWPAHEEKPILRLEIDGRAFAGGSMQGLEQSLRRFGPDIERKQRQIADERATIERLKAIASEPFHLAGDLARYEKALDDLEADIQANPVPPPAWLRAGAPIDTDVIWNGEPFTVTGHRWTADGWFVLAQDDSGPVVIPYLDARDAQGINLYEDRPFEAPEVIEVKPSREGPAAEGQEDSPAAHSIGRLTGGGFTSAEGLRRHLLGTRHSEAFRLLLDAGKIVIHADATSLPRKGRLDAEVQAMTAADGIVHLVASALTSRTALPVLLHEMFHSQVRPLIGSADWSALMQRMAALYRAAARRESGYDRPNNAYWRRALARVEAAAPPIGQEVEEFAAYAIEERALAPAGIGEIIDRMIGALKAWILRRFKVQAGRITPSQLHALAAAALRSGPNLVPARTQAAASTGPLDTYAAEIIAQLATVDDLFQNPVSTATSLAGVFADIDPTLQPVHVITSEASEKNGPFEGVLKEMRPAERVHVFRTARDRLFFVAEEGKDVWLDVSRLREGEAGSRIYAAVADYAFNTGRVFIGDPAGLSDIALRRRTEAMLASAIKHGTTKHLLPHERQTRGDSALGVPRLRWVEGDTLGNVQRMINVSLASLRNHVPEFERARYDFSTGTFRTGAGQPLTDRALDEWADTSPRARTSGAGSSTFKRGILLNTLARTEVAGRPGLLEQSLQIPDQLVGAQARGIFYSRVVPNVDEIDAATPGFIHNLVTKAMDGKTSVLGLIPLRPLISEMAARIPAAQDYLRLKQEMDAMRDKWHARADEVAQPWLKFRTLHKAQNAELMDIMHEATLTGADPAEAFTPSLTKLDRQILAEGPGTEAYDAAQAKVERDRDRKVAHDSLSARFAALPAEGRRLYRAVRDSYRRLSDAFEQALLDNLGKALDIKFAQAQRAYDAEMIRIHESSMEGEARELAFAAAEREMMKARQFHGWTKGARLTRLRHFFETNNLSGPYFPLARFGNFFVTVRDKETDQVISFSRFEWEGRQKAFAREMRAAGHDVQLGVLDDGGELRKQVDPRFVADVEAILEGEEISDAVRDAVWQRWLETMPDMSIRTSRIHRKGRAGFSTDALRAFGHHMFHGAHQLARLKYALDLDEAIALARDQAKTMRDPVRAGLIVNELARRNQFVMNPTGGWLAQAVTSAAFVYFLAVTPAAALVNTSQTVVLGVPILAAYHGGAARGSTVATAQLARALKDFTAGLGHAGRAAALSAEERSAMEAAYETGLIERTQSHDLAGVGETGVAYSPVRAKVMGAISWAFHHTERFNREVTFLAAYRMARAKGEGHNMAVETAADLTWKIHFDYQNTSRPRAMQGDTAKVLFVFRNFNVNMLWRLFRDVHQAIKPDGPGARREAITQLAGTTAMMMLSAGIRGTWLFGIAMMLATLFFGDDAEEEFKKVVIDTLGRRLGGMALNGIPGDLAGVDLSARIGMPDLWFRSPDRELEGASEFDYWAIQTLGAGVGALRNLWIGADMMLDGHVERGLETMAPKFVKDQLRAARYLNEGAQTLQGDPIMEDMSAADAFKQAMGFTPAELAERYDRNRAMKNKEQRILDERSKIMADYDAVNRADEDSTAVEERIDRFNEENPDYPITPRSLRQSMRSRAQMRERKAGGVYLNPKLRERLEAEAAPMVYGEEEEPAD